MGPQQLLVDAGPDVKALGIGLGHHVTQIAVALLVTAEQDEVVGVLVPVVLLVEAGAGGHIDLAADDGLHAGRLGRLVKVHHAVHGPVVGDRHRLLTQRLDPLHEPGDAAGAVQQGIFRMYVEMDKGHGRASSWRDQIT